MLLMLFYQVNLLGQVHLIDDAVDDDDGDDDDNDDDDADDDGDDDFLPGEPVGAGVGAERVSSLYDQDEPVGTSLTL